ncbi:MAG: hypothetical protein QOD63_964 [Actinomycetota bacterium]|nr:hypothetical protein [Actinomycetota bacterium]
MSTLGGRGVALIVVVLIAIGLAVVRAEGIVALVGPAVIGALCLALLVRFLTQDDEEADYRRIVRWTAVAFGVHLVLSLVITNTYVLLLYLGPDALTYDILAKHIVLHWTSGFPFPDIPSGKEGFYYLLAGLYWMFGAHTAAGLAVNATLAAGLVPLSTDTTRRLFGARAARYAAPLTLLVPGVLLWTSQLIKEAPILFLLALGANCAVRISDRISLAPLAVLAATMALLFTFRGWVGVMAAGGLVIGIAFGRHQLLSGLGTGVTALCLIGLLVVVTGLGYSGYKTAVGSDLEHASLVRRDLADSATSGFNAEADISTPTRALTYLPGAMVTFAVGPFPWQIGGVRQLPVIPDMVVWWALLPSLWRGVRVGGRQRGRQILVLLMPALTTALLLALALGNFGTLMRERTQVFILLVPFLCLGLSVRRLEPQVEEAGEDVASPVAPHA